MIKQEIISVYEDMAEKYNELIDHKPHNAYYERPAMLQLLPEVEGKVVLDVACGPGKYAEILLERGATVIGFDISPKMVEYAKERNPNRGTFFVHDLSEEFSMIDSDSCDVVICALALHYVEDWTLTLREFYRVLKPKGVLIISTGHPFSEYLYFKPENYFGIESVKCTWNGFGKPYVVNSFTRSLEETLNPIMENGFYIDKLVEPKPTAELEALDPKHFKELNEFPCFMCIRAVKRGEE